MRSADEIEERAAQMRRRMLKKMKRTYLQRYPTNCSHHITHVETLYLQPHKKNYCNALVPLGSVEERKTPVGLCGRIGDPEYNGRLCNHEEDAKQCPQYLAKYQVGEVRQMFQDLLNDEEVLKAEHPAYYALIWALDQNSYTEDVVWWRRWLRKLQISLGGKTS